MKELNIGNQIVRVRATPLALLFYKQEFKADLLGDLIKLGQAANDPSSLELLPMLQLIWAMAKADAFGKEFPSFESWLNSLESIDFSDAGFMTAAMEEAADGFFRTGVKGAIKN